MTVSQRVQRMIDLRNSKEFKEFIFKAPPNDSQPLKDILKKSGKCYDKFKRVFED